jgi:prepilin peptidase CpaA
MPLLQWSAVLGASLAAAVMDARSRRIPNRLTIPLALWGLASSSYFRGAAGGLDALAACLLLAFPYVLLFAFAGGGAGDAKLMGAIGTCVGLVQGLLVLAAVALCGVALGLVQAHAAGRSRQALAAGGDFARVMAARIFGGQAFDPAVALPPIGPSAQHVPYGLAICAGTFLAALGALSWRLV